MPFEPKKLRRLVLARAEPTAVGMSPIGGFLHPCGEADDGGVDVTCGAPDAAGRTLLAPVSPGLFRAVRIVASRPLALGEVVAIEGPGVLAFDGDRERTLAPGQRATLRVVRAGPRVIDVAAALGLAAREGVLLDRDHWHDPFDEAFGGGGMDCC
jgi:hypothetical protein